MNILIGFMNFENFEIDFLKKQMDSLEEYHFEYKILIDKSEIDVNTSKIQFKRSFDIILYRLSKNDSDFLSDFVDILDKMKRVPLIVITNKKEQDLIRDALIHGANDYLYLEEITPEILSVFIRHKIDQLMVDEQNQVLNAEFNAILNALDGMLYIASPNYKMEYMNQQFREFYKCDSIGGDCYKLIYGRTKKCEFCKIEEIQKSETIRKEIKNPQDNKWYSHVISPIFHPDGSNSILGLIQNIDEKKKYEQQQIEIKLISDSANRIRSEILHNISHELHTPMNGVLGFLDLLSQETYGPLSNTQKDVIRIISESAQKFDKSITDLIEASDYESGEIKLEKKQVELTEILMEICQRFQPRMQIRNQHFYFEANDYFSPVLLDVFRFKQVMNILIENAIKYTAYSGKIGLIIKEVANGVYFTIWDEGVGMTLEQQKQLFLPFQQLEQNINKQYEGLGLGLYLSKKLIEMHNGTISIESEIGIGTKVHTFLPRK